MAKKKERRRQQIPKEETKAARFIRVVTSRVSKALKAINQVGFCAASTYEYKPEQIKAIVDALSNAVVSVEDKFGKTAVAEGGFKFPE